MSTNILKRRDIEKLIEQLFDEAEYRKDLNAPKQVAGGAVWADRTGKLTGDLQTNCGPISFSDATIGLSAPPDPQLNRPESGISESFITIQKCARSLSESGETPDDLTAIWALRDQLADCLALTETYAASLAERLNIADMPTSFADSQHQITGISAHTERTLTAEEMASELGQISRPAHQHSVRLKHGIDHSKAF